MKFTVQDYNNILGLLGRVPLQGLGEAEAVVGLAYKLRLTIQEASKVDVVPASPAEAQQDIK